MIVSNITNELQFFIDIAEDKKLGMPSVICRKCCTVVITFDQFKRSVEEGQKKLIDIMERRKIREAKRLEQQQEQQVPTFILIAHFPA